MSLNNFKMLFKMGTDKEVLKNLFEIYCIFKEDKDFNIYKYIKLIFNILKGEKIIKFEDKYILSTFLPPFPSKAFKENMLAVKKPEKIFTQQIYAKRSAPISMYLCVTHKCPNNCIYCSSKNRAGDRELTTAEWIKVINELQEMKTSIIGITGGEPLVREDIFDIIKSIDDRSISILFTSGFKLTLDIAKELKKCGLFGIGISLDSHDKNKHNKNRNNEKAFEYALMALQNAREAGLYTMAQTVVLKEEIDELNLFKLFKLAKENGAHEVKLLEPILSGKLLTENNLKNIFYDNEDREKLIEIQHKANRKDIFPKITSFAYTESEEKFGCGAGTQHSYISATGHLYPCDFVPISFGNIRENSIKKLWCDMNEVIGIPKIGCFAQNINREICKKCNGVFPLNKDDSIEICKSAKSDKFPQYYRSLQ